MTTSVPPDDLGADLPPKQTNLARITYQAISERGVHRVSLQDIADRAGVSKGVILYHFKTRDNLLLETMRYALSRTARRIHKAIEAVPGAYAQVQAMVDVIFIEPEMNRRFYLTYLDLLDHAARDEAFERLNDTFRSIVNSLYADLIRTGIMEGVFEVDEVDEAATSMRAVIDGMFVQWLQESDWRGTHESYRELCKRTVLSCLNARDNR